MNNKKILLEEIERIHEIMGLPKKKLILESGGGRWEVLTDLADEFLASFTKVTDDVGNITVKFATYEWEKIVFDDVMSLLKTPDASVWRAMSTSDPEIFNKALLLIKNTYQGGNPRSVVDDIYDDLFTDLAKINDQSEFEVLEEINILMSANRWTMRKALEYLNIEDPFFIRTIQDKIKDRMIESKTPGFKDLNPKPGRLVADMQNAAAKVKYQPPPGLSLAHRVIFTQITLPKWALFAGSIQKYFAKVISDSLAKKKSLQQQLEFIMGDIAEAASLVSGDLASINSSKVLTRLMRASYGSQTIIAKSSADDLETLYKELETILKESLTGKQAEKIPEVMEQLRKQDPFSNTNFFGSWVDNFLSGTATSQAMKNLIDTFKIFGGQVDTAKKGLKDLSERVLMFASIGSFKKSSEIDEVIRSGYLFAWPPWRGTMFKLFSQLWVANKIGMPMMYFLYHFAVNLFNWINQIGNPDNRTFLQFCSDLWGKSTESQKLYDPSVDFGATGKILQSDFITFITPIHLNIVGWVKDLHDFFEAAQQDKINIPRVSKEKIGEKIDSLRQEWGIDSTSLKNQLDSAKKALEDAESQAEALQNMVDSTVNMQKSLIKATPENFKKEFGPRASKWCGDMSVGILTDGTYVTIDVQTQQWITFKVEDPSMYCQNSVTNF
jgi:hypothetical protein